MFLVAAPIAFLAFLATWLIPQVELRKWSHADAAAAASGEAAEIGESAAASALESPQSLESIESLEPQDASPEH